MKLSHLRDLALCCICFVFVAFSVSAQANKGSKADNEEMRAVYEGFQTLMKQVTKKDGADEKSKAVRDKNFALVAKAKDSLQQIFDSRREVLSRRPADLTGALKIISEGLSTHKKMFEKKGTVDATVATTGESSSLYAEILPKTQTILILLRCLDIVTSNSSEIISLLQSSNNATPVDQNTVEAIWNRFEPAVRYSPDDVQNLAKMLFIEPTKSKFEDKPNIPSYYIFHLFHDIVEKLQTAVNELNQAAFLRALEDVARGMQNLATDLDHTAKSDQTAKNTREFYVSARDRINFYIDFIQKRKKEWSEYFSTLIAIEKQAIKAIKECLEIKKDQSIFDQVEMNKNVENDASL